MENIFTLNIILYLTILVLSIMLIHLSLTGNLGIKFKIFCQTKTMIEYVILLYMVFSVITIILNLLYLIIESSGLTNSGIIYMSTNNNSDQDPIRWWPSGVAQTWGMLGAALAVYRATPAHPRVRAAAGLASFGLSIPTIVFTTAVENPNGFNKLMYSLMEYKRTGQWPRTIPENVSDSQLEPIVNKTVEQGESLLQANGLNTGGSNTSSFVSDGNILPDISFDGIINFFLQIFNNNPVEGYLDDLIARQLFIYCLLLLVVISLIILLFVYMVVNIFLQNKDFILNRFKNKYIRFFIKYQIFLGKLSIFTLPLLMLFGLLELVVMLHYLITHPIPLELLPIDLHTYLSSKGPK
jgi:hypothetical protein